MTDGNDATAHEPEKAVGIPSYAVLGLIASAPRSGYEIAGLLQRGVAGNLFARRPSASYDEPRRLIAQGFVTAEKVWQGRRPRTVYTVTDAGRRALGRWLARPSLPPVINIEALLKVLFAHTAGPGDPLRAVEDVAAWCRDRFALGESVLAEYQAGSGRFQDESRLVRLTMMANIELVDALARWSRRAAAELRTGGPQGFDDLVDDLRTRAAEHARVPRP